RRSAPPAARNPGRGCRRGPASGPAWRGRSPRAGRSRRRARTGRRFGAWRAGSEVARRSETAEEAKIAARFVQALPLRLVAVALPARLPAASGRGGPSTAPHARRRPRHPMSSAPPAPAALPASDRDRSVVFAAVLMTLFLAALDQTIVSTALPAMVEDLRGVDRYAWVA